VPRSMIGLQPQAARYLALQGAPIRADLGIAHRTGESAVAGRNFTATARSIGAGARTSRGDTSAAHHHTIILNVSILRGLMRPRTIIVATAHLTRDRARKSAARSAASCS